MRENEEKRREEFFVSSRESVMMKMMMLTNINSSTLKVFKEAPCRIFGNLLFVLFFIFIFILRIFRDLSFSYSRSRFVYFDLLFSRYYQKVTMTNHSLLRVIMWLS